MGWVTAICHVDVCCQNCMKIQSFGRRRFCRQRLSFATVCRTSGLPLNCATTMNDRSLPLPFVECLAQSLSHRAGLLSMLQALVKPTDEWTQQERELWNEPTQPADSMLVDQVAAAVALGQDPLGDAFCLLRDRSSRRDQGQTFTPAKVVGTMVGWAMQQAKTVSRVVDPGAGTGRFTMASLAAFPNASAIAIEPDPLLALILRANLAVSGLTGRVQVLVKDFRDVAFPEVAGTTLWIGNPPYVRHHDIEAHWKRWYGSELRRQGHPGSQLAGLHLHFFLKTLLSSRYGDLGCYITAAEWLDTNYGAALRHMLTTDLGGQSVCVVAPEERVFDDAMVTAAVTCFLPGSTPNSLQFALSERSTMRVVSEGARQVSIDRARSSARWTDLLRDDPPPPSGAHTELGQLFKVSRGQVTGMNRAWIVGPNTPALPQRYLVPVISDASDITRAPGFEIGSLAGLRRLVCLPEDLDSIDREEREQVETFLDWARSLGADQGYVARHRRPWWSIRFRQAPPPIVMTYMGRRPPVFAYNQAGAQLLNVAHGLYPKVALSQAQMGALVAWLNVNVPRGSGRAYAGGLVKFEPSEAMRLLVPAIV